MTPYFLESSFERVLKILVVSLTSYYLESSFERVLKVLGRGDGQNVVASILLQRILHVTFTDPFTYLCSQLLPTRHPCTSILLVLP